MDDIITAVSENQVDNILSSINGYNQHLLFTVEDENLFSVLFLDTKVIRTPGNVSLLNWFQKPTSVGRYMNFYNYHDMKIRTNLVLGLKHRILRICHHSLIHNNLIKLSNLLINNSCPKSFESLLFSTTHNRGNYVPTVRSSYYGSNRGKEPLPYIEEITPTLFNIIYSFIQSKYQNCTYNQDEISLKELSHVVYKIPCNH